MSSTLAHDPLLSAIAMTESRGSSLFPSLSLVADSCKYVSKVSAEASDICALTDEAHFSPRFRGGRTGRLDRAEKQLFFFFLVIL